ncbi:recombination regulator RecX [Alkalihalobacillus sp. LMS39]|uniref:recombination regulator RecX n=1 Tax=Alkalihalobacillus sp. LMS39 TaxID=2924032 RepID=UPI001FB2C3C6|nr:recombination regulator RecX [Alkalihalobacillus sp. LMS39]UOE94979.1 recombination regulator RecX [Alkalihalobacillus sp. LMS39]
MTVITRIVVQKNNKQRYSIFINRGQGEEYGFSVEEDVLISQGLQKGLEIDEDKLQQVLYEDQIRKAYNMAIQYLSYRLRTVKELTGYLHKKEYEADIITNVVERIKQHGYVNDLEFAEMFVRTRMSTSDKGPIVIRQELLQKGVAEEWIEQSLQQYSFLDQVEKVLTIIRKKEKQTSKESKQQQKQKIFTYIIAKGFSRDSIETAWKQLEPDEEEKQKEKEALQFQGEKALRKYKQYQGREKNMKIKQWLYRKGFSVYDIDLFLEENNE